MNRIGTKLDALVQSVENKTYPTEDIQKFVKGQLQELRSEMLRFDEVVAESRKAQESNDALQQKVEAEQQHGQLLTEQIRALHQNEKDLKARQTQLEQQLSDINDQVRVHDAEPSALEKEMGELRQQLRTVEDERAVKEVQIARLERNLEKRDRKLADFEVSHYQDYIQAVSDDVQKSYNPLKDRCEKLAAKLKESTKVRHLIVRRFAQTDTMCSHQMMRKSARACSKSSSKSFWTRRWATRTTSTV
jgi:chromosome segregation ATPase